MAFNEIRKKIKLSQGTCVLCVTRYFMFKIAFFFSNLSTFVQNVERSHKISHSCENRVPDVGPVQAARGNAYKQDHHQEVSLFLIFESFY